jgi:hypothetical protein
MCSEDRSLYVGVNLHDCLWPHMRKCKGTFLMHWVPIGPGCLSPQAPLIWVTTHSQNRKITTASVDGRICRPSDAANEWHDKNVDVPGTRTREVPRSRCRIAGRCRAGYVLSGHISTYLPNLHEYTWHIQYVPPRIRAGRSSHLLLESLHDQNGCHCRY